VDGSCSFAVINGRVRYWDLEKPRLHVEPPVCEIDVSPDIRPGQVNRIVLGTDALFKGWPAQDLRYNHLELAIYRPGKWSLDGRSNRDALTATELGRVAQDLGTAQFYPMIHPVTPKLAPSFPPAGNAPAALPPPILDLDLHPAGALALDKGPNHLPVAASGSVEPSGEASDALAAVYFRGDGSAPGGLSVSSAMLSQCVRGKAFTIRTWIMPMAGGGHGGVIVGCNPLKWNIVDDASTVWLGNPPNRKLIATNVISPGAWQSLALVVDRPRATLFVNGISVAIQTWSAPIEGGNDLVTIGNTAMKADFLNAKMAAFTVYEGALTAGQIAAQYASERSRFLPGSASAAP